MRYRRRRRRKTIVIKNHKDFLEQCKNKHYDKYSYGKTKFTDYNSKVIIRCKIHGEFTIKPRRVLVKRGGCPKCRKSSNGEVRTMLFLVNNNIKYIEEYSFSDSRWRYDFYLPDLGIVIEYDGIQHFKVVRKFGGRRVLEDSKQRDRDKDLLAKKNGVRVLRIPYTEYDNLNDYLLFKLSKIYKYKVRNRYYKNFIELCKGLKVTTNLKPKDVKEYLTYT